MHKEHEIVAAVTAAKKDREKADALLRDYLPFIRAQAAKQVGHPVSDQDDAQSIAMIASSTISAEKRGIRASFLLTRSRATIRARCWKKLPIRAIVSPKRRDWRRRRKRSPSWQR